MADQLADPFPDHGVLAEMQNRRQLPLHIFEVTAQDVMEGALIPNHWWWIGNTPQDTLLAPLPLLSAYLEKRASRSKHNIPWAEAQLGLLLRMIRLHPDGKTSRDRPRLLRYIWDCIPHLRNLSKYTGGGPIPFCELCQTSTEGDPDDLHHLLVVCPHPAICSLRDSTLRAALGRIYATSALLPLAKTYFGLIDQVLRSPDPTRLSHALWVARPFQSTLMHLDSLMPSSLLSSSVLVQLAHLLPKYLVELLDGLIALWRLHCQLTHPPEPLPLQVISGKLMRRQKQRKRSHKLCTPSGSTQSSSPSDQSVADRPGHSDNLSRDAIRVPSLHRALRVFPDSLHPQISHVSCNPEFQVTLCKPRWNPHIPSQ